MLANKYTETSIGNEVALEKNNDSVNYLSVKANELIETNGLCNFSIYRKDSTYRLAHHSVFKTSPISHTIAHVTHNHYKILLWEIDNISLDETNLTATQIPLSANDPLRTLFKESIRPADSSIYKVTVKPRNFASEKDLGFTPLVLGTYGYASLKPEDTMLIKFIARSTAQPEANLIFNVDSQYALSDIHFEWLYNSAGRITNEWTEVTGIITNTSNSTINLKPENVCFSNYADIDIMYLNTLILPSKYTYLKLYSPFENQTLIYRGRLIDPNFIEEAVIPDPLNKHNIILQKTVTKKRTRSKKGA